MYIQHNARGMMVETTDIWIFAAGSSEIDSRAVSTVAADNAFAGLFVQTGTSALFADPSAW